MFYQLRVATPRGARAPDNIPSDSILFFPSIRICFVRRIIRGNTTPMLRLWPSTLVECRSTVVSNCRHRCGDKDRNSWLDVLAEQRFNIQSA
ncbi:hypothetical protein EVAR_98233_1 [Eumeta japonica]|uniref:Uncharacterized protein n=1 Tax=Eumeta variegata TaxID=151549 RepID=A0A4C1Y1A0_EUMVA|nr:hypothetical protein EVAR_98233_1 [Eumeta japonica]